MTPQPTAGPHLKGCFFEVNPPQDLLNGFSLAKYDSYFPMDIPQNDYICHLPLQWVIGYDWTVYLYIYTHTPISEY